MNADFVRTVCGTCRKPIDLHTNHQINGIASCWYCFSDHKISQNTLPCPYRIPKSRKLIDRTDQDLSPMERLKNKMGAEDFSRAFGFGQASGFVTTVAATNPIIKDPEGGL